MSRNTLNSGSLSQDWGVSLKSALLCTMWGSNDAGWSFKSAHSYRDRVGRITEHGEYRALIASEVPKVGMNYVALMYDLLPLEYSKPPGNSVPYRCQPCRFK